jgi:hypothetical protein
MVSWVRGIEWKNSPIHWIEWSIDALVSASLMWLSFIQTSMTIDDDENLPKANKTNHPNKGKRKKYKI